MTSVNITENKYKVTVTEGDTDLVTVTAGDTNLVTVTAAGGLEFLQTGTGAVKRTVDSKLKEIVSVEDFGATGNGSTDDTTAIQAALAASKHVVFPEGTYLISNKLDVTLTDAYIEGLGTVEIKQTTYPQNVFFVSGDNCTIKNFKLTGVPTKTLLSTAPADRYFGDTQSSQSSAIYLYIADNLDVIHCNIVNFFAGVFLKGGQNFSYKTGLTGDRMTTTTFELDSSDQQADNFWQGDEINGFGYIRVLSDSAATPVVRVQSYANATNKVTFGTSQNDITLSDGESFSYFITKGRSKNILITGCRFDLVDMGILGNHVENLVIEDSVFETIEQTQQVNVRPHSIYLNGGDNKKVKASGLITYNCPNGDAYKFLATDGLFLSDLDAYNSRGTFSLEGCINVTGNNLTCLLSGDLDPPITTTAITNVSASTIVSTAHGLASGTPVILRGLTNTTGSVTVDGTPINLSNDRVWYVSQTSNLADSFRLTTASDGAASGNFTFGGSDDTGITIFNTFYFTPDLANITDSRNVYLSNLTLTLDEDYDATSLAASRPSIAKIIGNDDLNRGDLGTMTQTSTIVPTDTHIKDVIVDAQGYTGDVRGVIADLIIHKATYGRSGSTITVNNRTYKTDGTIGNPSEHNVKVGDSISFVSTNDGTQATDNTYTVVSVSSDKKSFTITDSVSGTITDAADGTTSCTFTNKSYKVTKSTFENISIVNGASANFNAVRVVHGDNITIRYPSYTKGDVPSTKQVQLNSGCTNTTVVFHPDQTDFTFTNEGGTTNVLLNVAPQAKGTWTPSITGTGGSANTQNIQLGEWTKIGDLVHLTCRVSISAKNATGAVSISGLPFASDTMDASSSAIFSQSGTLSFYENVSFTSVPVILTLANAASAIKVQYSNTANITDVDHAQLTATSRFDFSFTYKADSFTDFTPA